MRLVATTITTDLSMHAYRVVVLVKRPLMASAQHHKAGIADALA
jgi:hypothetical protein